jgi:hypothetical protein
MARLDRRTGVAHRAAQRRPLQRVAATAERPDVHGSPAEVVTNRSYYWFAPLAFRLRGFPADRARGRWLRVGAGVARWKRREAALADMVRDLRRLQRCEPNPLNVCHI